MRTRATQRGRRFLVPFETLEFVYISHTGIIPVFSGRKAPHFKHLDRMLYLYLIRRCCGLKSDDIANLFGITKRMVEFATKGTRYRLYRSYPQYYDPEFAALYKTIRAQCRVIAGLKESTIKKYKQQGKL